MQVFPATLKEIGVDGVKAYVIVPEAPGLGGVMKSARVVMLTVSAYAAADRNTEATTNKIFFITFSLNDNAAEWIKAMTETHHRCKSE